MNSRKSISPVVAVALLLVVAVVAVIAFQGWFQTYTSNLFSKTEIQSNVAMSNSGIENLIDNSLYVKNGKTTNFTATGVKLGGVDCNINTNLSPGITELDVSVCMKQVTTQTPEAIVYTNDGIYSKKFYLKDMPVFVPSIANNFVTQWNTSIDAGLGSVSANNQIRLPLLSNGIYNFVVYWGDGTNSTITKYNQAEVLHTYVSPGIYTVNITGQLEGFSFTTGETWTDDLNDGDKLINIIRWGNINLGNGGEYFSNCDNFIMNATDSPDLSKTTNLDRMFAFAINFNQSINHWDVSHVNTISGMFYTASNFNQPLNNWNTSSVIDMSGMFIGATSFNQSLNNWNTSSVIYMSGMFSMTNNFNQPLNNWNTNSVIYMSGMFMGAINFNQPLNNWSTSSVTDMSMMFTFSGFNQSINNWNTSSVTNMNNMFMMTSKFNQPLNNWDVRHVTNMSGMFKTATNFNQPLNNWNTSSVIDMNSMFNFATKFNQNLSMWNVSQIILVTQCDDFNFMTAAWTLPKPNLPGGCLP